MNSYAPIALFVYNRLEHTIKAVEALKNNELASESILYIFADGVKEHSTDEQKNSVVAVRDYVRTITGFKEIHHVFSDKNNGLANSIIKGVTNVVEKFGRVIVVEDDLVTNKFFLRFMNDALDFYNNDNRIFAVGGYNYNLEIPTEYKKDIYLSYRCQSWGWATWIDRWEKVNWNIDTYKIIQNPTRYRIWKFCRGGQDLYPMLLSQADGKIDSWAIRFGYNMCINDAYCLLPVCSFVHNCGFDGSGVHCGSSSERSAPIYSKNNYDISLERHIRKDRKMTGAVYEYHRIIPVVSFTKRLKRYIKKVLHI